MKISSFLLCAVVLSYTLFAQNFYAGDWTPEQDNYYAFYPQFILQYTPPSATHVLHLDLNGDGLNDVQFVSYYYNGYQWGSMESMTIEPLNGCEIAYSIQKYCMANDTVPVIAKTLMYSYEFHAHEQINNFSKWTDTTTTLAHWEWSANYPGNWGYSCSRNSPLSSSVGYLGVRFFVQSDTIYGWIKVGHISNTGCTVYSYACTDGTYINIEEPIALQKTKLLLHPNPSQGVFRYQLSEAYGNPDEIHIFNTTGVCVYQSKGNNLNQLIDLTFLPEGLYWISLKTTLGIELSEKILITK